MAPAHFRILNNEFLNKDTDVVPEKAPLIIFDIKSAVCMTNKSTKHNIYITRRMHLIKSAEYWNLHKTVWCEGGLKLVDIGTKNVREYEFNSWL